MKAIKKIQKLMAFSKYLYEEYQAYPQDTISKMLKFGSELKLEDVDHFVDHIKMHHNHAFESLIDWQQAVNVACIAGTLSGEAKEVLGQLVENPKFDGDVVSKNGKCELYRSGLATRVCVDGVHGHNAANYMGWRVWRLLEGKLP